MRRRNVPCSPCSGGSSSGDCCSLKEKLRILWNRTIGSILRINGITPDGDGDFTIEAGSNIALSETGTGNGIRIDTTGGVSYYESGDSLVDVDNNDLKISLVTGNGGVALHDDLETVAQAVDDIVDGDITVPEATHATNADNATNAGYADNAGNATYAGSATNAVYLGSVSSNVGTDTKPVKIVNGQAVAVTYDLVTLSTEQIINAKKTFTQNVKMGSTLTITSYMDSSIGAINMLIGEHQTTHYKARLTMNIKNDNTIEIWLQKVGPNDEFLGQVLVSSI